MTNANPHTTLRVDWDGVESSQLDTLMKTLRWLEEMRNVGWIIKLHGHLTADVVRATVSPIVERNARVARERAEDAADEQALTKELGK